MIAELKKLNLMDCCRNFRNRYAHHIAPARIVFLVSAIFMMNPSNAKNYTIKNP